MEKERRAVLSELQMMNTIEYRVDCQVTISSDANRTSNLKKSLWLNCLAVDLPFFRIAENIELAAMWCRFERCQ